MKKIFMLCCLLPAIMFVSCGSEETQYCGPVVEKFMTPVGHRSPAEPHVIFYNDSLKRSIDVRVSWNTYANVDVGAFVCFALSEWELNR
jgi:hypothetical protein